MRSCYARVAPTMPRIAKGCISMNVGRFRRISIPCDPCRLCGNAREYREGLARPIHLGKCIPRKSRGYVVQCKSCKHPISGTYGDVAIIVERHDLTISVYCVRCAPTLVGVSQAVDDGRIYRQFVADRGLTRRKKSANVFTHTVCYIPKPNT